MNKFKISADELSFIMPFLRHLACADNESREKVQQMGINVLPCDYYSNTPSVEDIAGSFEYSTEEPPYFNPQIFDLNKLQKTLDKLINFSTEFCPPVNESKEDNQQFFWENSQFSYSDAMSYYCFSRLIKPSTIVEIGSGFSTLIALEAVEKNGSGTIHCIEPFPREFLKGNDKLNLHCVSAQELPVEFLNDTLQDGDILFIDSTHTVKSGSDCLHIYLRMLPNIRRNIFVQVHDIFLPFGLPKDWLLNRNIYWTEQYLLFAFLLDNPRASLLYGSNFNAMSYPAQMEKLMGGKFQPGGSSVWFKYSGNKKCVLQ